MDKISSARLESNTPLHSSQASAAPFNVAWLADKFNFKISDVDKAEFDASGNFEVYFNADKKDVANKFVLDLSKRKCHAEYHAPRNSVLLKKDQTNNILTAGNISQKLPAGQGTLPSGARNGSAYTANKLRDQVKTKQAGASKQSAEEIKADNFILLRAYKHALKIAQGTESSDRMVGKASIKKWCTCATNIVRWANEKNRHIRSMKGDEWKAMIGQYSKSPVAAKILKSQRLSKLMYNINAFEYWKDTGKVQLRHNVVTPETTEQAQLMASNKQLLADFEEFINNQVHVKKISDSYNVNIKSSVRTFVADCNKNCLDLASMDAEAWKIAIHNHVENNFSHLYLSSCPQSIPLLLARLNNFRRWLPAPVSDKELRQASMANNGDSHRSKRQKTNADTRTDQSSDQNSEGVDPELDDSILELLPPPGDQQKAIEQVFPTGQSDSQRQDEMVNELRDSLDWLDSVEITFDNFWGGNTPPTN